MRYKECHHIPVEGKHFRLLFQLKICVFNLSREAGSILELLSTHSHNPVWQGGRVPNRLYNPVLEASNDDWSPYESSWISNLKDNQIKIKFYHLFIVYSQQLRLSKFVRFRRNNVV
jgi:hypothetical protein